VIAMWHRAISALGLLLGLPLTREQAEADAVQRLTGRLRDVTARIEGAADEIRRH